MRCFFFVCFIYLLITVPPSEVDNSQKGNRTVESLYMTDRQWLGTKQLSPFINRTKKKWFHPNKFEPAVFWLWSKHSVPYPPTSPPLHSPPRPPSHRLLINKYCLIFNTVITGWVGCYNGGEACTRRSESLQELSCHTQAKRYTDIDVPNGGGGICAQRLKIIPPTTIVLFIIYKRFYFYLFWFSPGINEELTGVSISG